MASSVALDVSSGMVTMSLASNSRALTTMKQTFSGEIESAGVALVVAASSAVAALLSGLPALMAFLLALIAQATPRGGSDVEIGQVRSRPIQLPPTLTYERLTVAQAMRCARSSWSGSPVCAA